MGICSQIRLKVSSGNELDETQIKIRKEIMVRNIKVNIYDIF